MSLTRKKKLKTDFEIFAILKLEEFVLFILEINVNITSLLLYIYQLVTLV